MTDKPRVILTDDEVVACTLVGVRRHTKSVAKNRTPAHGADGKDSLLIHIEGACGEMAAAKFLGCYWGFHTNTFKGPDIGSKLQVRTRSNHAYDLLVRRDDNPDHAYLLVTGTPPEFIIHGWMWGSEAKQDIYRAVHGNRPAAFFVPQAMLRPPVRPT